MQDLQYLRPASLSEAARPRRILTRPPAGGQTTLPSIVSGCSRRHALSISARSRAAFVRMEGKSRDRAMTRHAEVASSAEVRAQTGARRARWRNR
jgi:hypothetical protein